MRRSSSVLAPPSRSRLQSYEILKSRSMVSVVVSLIPAILGVPLGVRQRGSDAKARSAPLRVERTDHQRQKRTSGLSAKA